MVATLANGPLVFNPPFLQLLSGRRHFLTGIPMLEALILWLYFIHWKES